jgi:hypothetical protein
MVPYAPLSCPRAEKYVFIHSQKREEENKEECSHNGKKAIEALKGKK